jgi:hypothetical protein
VSLCRAASVKKWEIYHQPQWNTFFAIEEDSEGNIWFGDRDTGAWRYDGKTVMSSHYQ